MCAVRPLKKVQEIKKSLAKLPKTYFFTASAMSNPKSEISGTKYVTNNRCRYFLYFTEDFKGPMKNMCVFSTQQLDLDSGSQSLFALQKAVAVKVSGGDRF